MYEIAFRKISTRSLLRRVTAEEQVPIGREFVSHVRDGGAPRMDGIAGAAFLNLLRAGEPGQRRADRIVPPGA